MHRLAPSLLFFIAYFGGGVLVITLGASALFLIARRHAWTATAVAAFFFSAAGHATAIRDTLPVVETHSVSFADSEVLRLENGMTLRHDGSLIPKEGDEVRFVSSSVAREHGTPLLTSFEVVREKGLRSRLTDFVRERSGSTLLLAFATGKRSFSPAERIAFLKTGTMHLVAISAFHIGILFLLLHLVARLGAFFPTTHPRTSLFLTMLLKSVVLFWYLSITGWCTPTLRAAIFVLLLDLLLHTGHAAHPFPVFLWSLMLTAIALPRSMVSWSFIMSALSVFAVLSLWDRLSRSSFISILALSVIINFLLIPISAQISGVLPLIAAPANLVTIPLASLLLLSLIPVQAFFPFLPSLAGLFLLPADTIAQVMTGNLHYLASLSDPTLLPLRQAGTPWIILFYAAAGAALLGAGAVRRWAAVAVAVATIPFFITIKQHHGIERIHSLPGDAYCVREEHGTGRIVEARRYNFPSDYVQRKFDMLPMSLERDLSHCGVLQVTSLHLRAPLPRDMARELFRRPRFRGTRLYLTGSFPDTGADRPFF